MTPEERDSILDALRFLKAQFARRGELAEARMLSHVDDVASPADGLSRAASGLGLDISEVVLSPNASPEVVPDAVFLAWSAPNRQFVRIENMNDRIVRVRALDRERPVVTSMPRTELSQYLGVSERVVLYSVVDRRPLETMVTPPKDAGKPWRRLLVWLQLERRDIAAVTLYAIGAGVLSLAVPLVVQSLFTTVTFGTLLQPLFSLAIILFVAAGAAAALSAVQSVLVEFMGRRIFVLTARDFTNRVPFARAAASTHDLNETVNRFLDVAVFEKSFAVVLLDGLSSVLQIAVGLVLLGFYHPYLLAFDFVLVSSVAFIILVLGRKAVRTALNESKRKYRMVAWLQDITTSVGLFASRRGFRYANARTETLATEWLDARSQHFRIVLRQFVAMLMVQVATTGVTLVVGGILVIQRQLTLGQLVAAELVIALTVSSLAKLAKLFPKVYDLLAAADKIGEVIDIRINDQQGFELSEKVDGLDVEVVAGDDRASIPSATMSYLAHDGVHAEILRRNLRSLDYPDRGQVYLDGTDLWDLGAQGVRDQILWLADDQLFPGTIRENVTVGDLSVSPEAVDQALERAGLGPTLRQLPDGVDTHLNRRAAPLSAVGRVRVLVARAIVLKPRLLILDGALDGLQHECVEHIRNIFAAPEFQWTVIDLTRVRPLDDNAGADETRVA